MGTTQTAPDLAVEFVQADESTTTLLCTRQAFVLLAERLLQRDLADGWQLTVRKAA